MRSSPRPSIAAATATLLCAGLVLGGCATGTHYVPAVRAGAPGFSEQQIEADRWRVDFVTGDGASPALAGDYALLRAAELTLGKGGEWFTVVDRGVAPVAPRGPRFSVGVGGADFGRRSAVGGGVGTGFGGGAGAAASLEIVIGHGPRPGRPDAYDARAVSDRLRARLPQG